ncbi:alpha-tectorin [Larimichthys crocea]|uniref:alpha-tectorin n=1 Tax=Larimichthys crocea TaxID=215358 RepID=UPI000F5FCB0A|nr:alpha-tectorin-like [Larimichthys crocea]
MAHPIMLPVLLLGMIRPLYPISGTEIDRSDDGGSPKITLQRSYVYFGQAYNQIFVNQNGHLTFFGIWSSFIPQKFPLHGSKDVIAPFWTDLDNRESGYVYYNQYTSGIVLQQATQDINDYFPTLNFNANWVFVATWYEVAYFPNSGTAGYDTINSTHHFTIPGSFSSNATGSKSTFRWSSNVNKPGRWAFRTDHGTRGCIFNEQCGGGLPYYRVEGKNEHLSSSRVSWTRLVKVYVYNETIELVKGRRGEAKVNGIFLATPIYLNNGTVQVYESGFSVIISTDFGLEVSYNKYYRLRISVPYTYQNATCGLCGNFNNIPGDDFRTPQGEVVDSDVDFANSWKASGDDEPGCEPVCAGLDCAACTRDQTALYSDNAYCGILLSESGPFAACHQRLPPEAFVQSCVFDLCVAGGYQPILCQALTTYASQCQQIGIQVPSWRRQGFCEIPCPSNSHFESQGTGCPATCVNPNSTQDCPLPAQESCICNSGYILSAGVCVPHSECGCTFEGRYYRSGETVIPDEDCRRRCSCSYGSMTCHSHGCDPLESCKVVDGKRGCRPNSYAACSIRGPGSYQTFDGLTYQYPGACRLILAKVMGMSSHNHFSVTIEKTPRGLQGFDTLLKIEVEDSQVSIMSSSIVQVDGQKIRLPFSLASNRIQIYHSSIHSIILRTAFGVTVETDGSHIVHVTAPSIYNGSLGGLCGNYNGHPGDDFRTPNGILVNSSQVFGDSWRNGSLTAECVKSTIIIGTDCPPNSHYDLCGSPCPSTCPSLSFPFTCITVCKEGCFCDDGFVLDGNRCVRPTDCGCYHQERYVQAGEQFWDGEECQNLCTCNGTTAAVNCIPSSCGPQESCRVVEGEFGCHHKPNGICSASGDPHYLTFDGKAYDFQGTCRYVLATPCNATDNLPQFSVEAKNEPWFGLPFSSTEEVFVNVSGYQVHLSGSSNGVVQVNGITKNLPINLNGGHLSINAKGSETFVSADFGLTVTYNGWRVSISVPPIYSGKTCGLCGNFNGNPNDDFHTPTGIIVTTPDEFGKSWKVAGNYTCSDGCGSSCPQCTNDLPARAQCAVIQAADGPLSFCHEQVDPAPYFNDCVFDVCVSGNGLCESIETYVRACQSANVPIYPWRQNTTCRITCLENEHYELCGTDCGRTCGRSNRASCGIDCSEGCFCDREFFRSGTRCVPLENCGCQRDGEYYNAGESFWTDGCTQRCECHGPNDLRCSAASCTPLQKCTIRNGQLGCFGDFTTCTVWGDPHYITFDGATAHFQGTCSYIIAESVNHHANETQFHVTATNNHRGNNRVSFVSAVDISLLSLIKRERAHIRIGPNKRVKVNGREVSLPTTAGTLAQVERQGNDIEVHAEDLIVQFDGQSILLVRVGQNRQNRVSGMCGNFNNNPADDKVLPNGTLAQNDCEFGHSWKSSTSQPGCGSTDVDICGGWDDCRFIEEYSELCSVITNTSGPFSSCHLHSDPQPFFDSCVYDLCLYTPANGMLCAAVAAYERTCSVLGLNITEWRSALQCAETDPCEQLNCTEYEWCGEKDGVYGCFCDEHYRPNNESYDSSITCLGSSGTISLSRCQLFEAGFHPSSLHLQDFTCKGTLEDGRLIFHFNNKDQLCGTVLKSNGSHFSYVNSIQADDGINIQLVFCCEYPLTQALSMDIGINPVESFVKKKLPIGHGHYHLRIIPYHDAHFSAPLTSPINVEMEIGERLYVEVRAEGVDEQQVAAVVDSCWATPLDNASCPIRRDLIMNKCPDSTDDTVELFQNGNSTVAQFSFKIFSFTNFPSIYLHCQIHLCLLRNNCTVNCNTDHNRGKRDVSYYDTVMLSLGPLRYTTK